MARPRVLVTGGTGFIGRRVVARFLAAGWDVTSFSLPGEAVPAWPAPVRMVHGDLADRDDVAEASAGAGLLVHLAAVVGVPGDYARQWDIIAEGTANVCEAMAAAGGRALVVSSIAVYGDLIRRQVCREDDGFGAWQGAYGRAKQGQERVAQDIAWATGMPLTLVRPANVYGLAGPGGGASAWGERMIEGFRATGGAIVGDAAHNDAGLVHVENLADALYLAATLPQAVGRTYNVCDENGVTWATFLADIARLAGVAPPPQLPLEPVLAACDANEDPAALIGPRDPALPSLEALNLIGFSNRIDAGRIRAELGWHPRVTYAEAMAEMTRSLNT